MSTLHVVCAWCQTVLCEGTPGALTSHGMCDACSATLLADLDDDPQPVPVSAVERFLEEAQRARA